MRNVFPNTKKIEPQGTRKLAPSNTHRDLRVIEKLIKPARQEDHKGKRRGRQQEKKFRAEELTSRAELAKQATWQTLTQSDFERRGDERYATQYVRENFAYIKQREGHFVPDPE